MYLPPSCSTRGVPRVVVIVPKPLLEGLLLLGFAKFGWFRTLNPSNSNITVCSPWTLNSRETRALNVRNPGPSMILRPAVPNVPIGLVTTALVLNQQLTDPTGDPLGQLPLRGSPTRFTRSCRTPVRELSVPPTIEK